MKTTPVIPVAALRRALASATVTSAFLGAVLLGASAMAGTTNYYWNNVGADFYTNDLNWVSNAAPMGLQNPLGPKGSVNYAVNITNGGTINYGDGGGGPSTGYTWTNVLGSLLIAPNASGSGVFNLTSDSLAVTNSGASELVLGGGASSTASMTMSGGTFTAARDVATLFQDFFIVGNAVGATATFSISGGVLTNLSGIEIGNGGTGTFNVSGGELIDNGWFGVGRGGTAGNSFGTFNLSGGTIYILRNVGTDGGDNGVYLGQGATNSSIANISGGSLYCIGIGMGGGGAQSSQFLNMSAGTLYIGSRGVGNNGNGNHFSTISGGTFHTLGMTTNIASDQGDLGSILANGTNWTFAATPTVNLTNSSYAVNGVSGPGYVTFAPEATRTITLNNQWVGVGGLVVNGPGTIAMGAANTYTGGTTISQGNLTFNTGGSVVDSVLSIPSGSTLTFNETGTTTFTNVVTGAGNIVLANSGVVNVGSNLKNTGTISQNNGILAVNGSISIPGALTNSSPATVGPLVAQGTIMTPIGIGANSSIETGNTVQPGTLTASNVVLNGTWIVKINTATTVGNGVNDLLICSNLFLNPGSSALSVIAQSTPTVGTYVIGEYTGAVTGSNNFAIVTNGLRNASMSVTIGGGQIVLNVNSLNPANLVWAATNFSPNINWDVNTSSNWTNTATSALDTFHQQDAVAFNAVPGSGITNRVNVTGQVTPSSINISGGLPYLIAGTGYISGGTGINYNDTNTSGIYTSGNNYTGPVSINAGVLQLGSGGSSWLGATNGATTISGGTLDLNAQGVGAEPLVIQGAGSTTTGTNTGAINNSASTSPGQSAGPLNVTLNGDTTLSASGNRWDIGVATLGAGGGSFKGNGFNLTKVGNQAIWMHELGDIGVGNIDIQKGLLGFEFTIGMGVSSDIVTVESGATLGLYQLSSNSILNKQMVLNGNATISSGGGAGSSNNFVGPITLNGTNTILTSIFPLNLPGNITGTGGLIVSGTGPLILGGDDTYSGPTLIGPSTVLAVESGGSIPNTPLIYMSPSANTVIDASGAGSMTLGTGQTLEGSGSIKGNFTANSGSSIVLGTNATTYGTIVFTNNLTLNGDTNYLKISDPFNTGVDNDLLQVNGTLTLSGITTIIVSPLAALDPTMTYTLMQFGGIVGNAGNLRVISASPRYTMTPVINGNLVQLNIVGNSAPLEWEGTLTPNWDLITSNWFNMGVAVQDHFYNGDNPTFDDSSSVTGVVVTNNVIAADMTMSNVVKTYTFSGGGVISGPLDIEGNGNVGGTTILAMSNAPAFTSIDASAGTLVFNLQGLTNYTVAAGLTDSNGLQAGTIIFGGTNTAVLAGNSVATPVFGNTYNPDFDGTIWVTNGILQYTNVDALGVDAAVNNNPSFSPLIITNNGTLDFDGVPAGTANAAPYGGDKWIHISGNGFNGKGVLTDTKNNQEPSGAFCNLYLDGNAIINIPTARCDQHVLSGNAEQVEGNGYNLTFMGGGALFFNPQADGDTHLGNIDVACTNGGRLAFQSGPDSLGITTNYLVLESGSEVTFYNFSNSLDTVHLGIQKNVWLKGNATIDSGGNGGTESNNFNCPIFLTGTNLIGVRYDMHVWGSIMDSNGPGGIVLGSDSVGASGANSGLWLDGTNTYSGPTVISNATLHVGVNSSLGLSSYIQVNSGATLDLSATPVYSFGTGQTVAGNGTVNGPATGNLNFNAGGILAIGLPTTNGVPNTNTFTLTVSNSVVFNAGSTIDIAANEKTEAVGAVPADKLAGPTSLTLGGTVTVTNFGGAPFIGGDSLALFSATAISTNSGFNIVPATPGPNLAWDISTIPVDGTLRVLSTLVVNPNPTNIVFSVSGNQLTLTWPTDHTGWELEIQTNKLSVGLSTNWVTYPASTTVNSISIPINLANGTVFYRLVYPPQ
ncbi:MAG TPA: autotransporter-associated beta strand repeat-containing protein [Verrucomicrobiae bacterium]